MKKILLAFDSSEASRHALSQAAELARALPATVTVVSVVPEHPGRARLDPWDDREVHTSALREAYHLLMQDGIEPSLLEPAGDPARTIEQIADEGAYDMVIVGSRGMGAIGRMFEGSVSEHVATHARQTVVVVH